MGKIARFAFTTSVLFLFAGAPRLYADSINITSGSLDVTSGSAVLSLAGAGGFTLHALPDISIGTLLPYNCWMSPCAPGTTINLAAFWSGGDLLANTVSYHGVTATAVGSAGALASASVAFAGTALAPAFLGSTTAFVQAPFAFSGDYYPGVAGLVDARLTGAGTVSLWLTLDRSFGGLSWAPTSARYDFAVTPEPTSMLLIGSGLVGVFGIVRRRSALARRSG